MTDRYAAYNTLKFDYPADRVLRITFDNPETYNSVTAEMHTHMTDIWRDIDSDPDINAVIVTGAGKAFSSGGDFDFVQSMVGDHKQLMKTWKEAKDLVYNIINCNKPLISAINGPAAGAGLAVALCADISIAAQDAKLTDAHSRIGVASGDHAVMLWPLFCGMPKAKRYLLTGDVILGEEAERIGLVSMAVPRERVLEEALVLADRLGRGPQRALRWTKRSLNHWLRQAGPMFDLSVAYESLTFMEDDAWEGMKAFAEKREPRFRSKPE